MSLKAKLEAVIYAAEEPVTLAQLAILFTEEALTWKAEQEAAASASVPGDEGAGSMDAAPVNAEFDYREVEAAASQVAELGEGEVPAAAEGESAEGQAKAGSDAVEQDAVGGEAVLEPAAEAKKLARQRDREVRGILRQLLDELVANYAADERGIEIREIAGGYRMATKPECHDSVRAFVKSLKPALKLSMPALETLAVIAYKQPVTAPEVNEIRGVDSSGVFGSLLARKLIATAGRKQVIGRPILYKTTREFLLRFGLKDVAELPSMEEFEKMAAIELDDAEPAATGVAASEAANEVANEGSAELSLEQDEDAGDEAVAMTAENDTTISDSAPGGAEQAKD